MTHPEREVRGILFTQYLLPNGRRQPQWIDRPAEVEAKAQRFIAAGGWYECEILTTGQVSFTACMNVNGEPQDIEFQICANGPDVLDAVDQLVDASFKYVGRPE